MIPQESGHFQGLYRKYFPEPALKHVERRYYRQANALAMSAASRGFGDAVIIGALDGVAEFERNKKPEPADELTPV